MATAKLVPALVQLRAQVNSKWPGRDKSSDGWVGDVSHSARVSDHNPDRSGWVHALDIDKDGISPYEVVGVAIRDSRVNYVIFNKIIYSRAFSFRPRAYTGVNGHTHHIHISVLHGSFAGDGRAWALPGGHALDAGKVQVVAGSTGTSPAPAPSVNDVLRENDRGAGVLVWQGELWRLGIGVGAHDSIFGSATRQGTLSLQHAAGIKADGVVGGVTRAAAKTVPSYPKPGGPALPLCGYGGPGDTIEAFQRRLKGRGWKVGVLRQYDAPTREAITKFQRQVGLPADGVGGPQVWIALWTRKIT